MSLASTVRALLMPVVLAGLAACNPAAEGPEPGVVETKDAADSVHLRIRDESGDVTYQRPSAGMPEGFPTGFPIPAGAIEQAHRLLVGGQPMWSAVIQTQADYAQTIGFFQTELPAAGWTVTDAREAEMDWGKTFFMRVSAPEAAVTGSVTIEDREGGASVTISLTERR